MGGVTYQMCCVLKNVYLQHSSTNYQLPNLIKLKIIIKQYSYHLYWEKGEGALQIYFVLKKF